LDAVHIACDVANSPVGEAALAANCDLPGNLRFAIARGRMQLRAETELTDDEELATTLVLVRAGMDQALGDGAAQPQPSIDPLAVETALHRLPWEDDAVVQLESGWELRPRIAGQPTPVRMTVGDAELRFRRVVLSRPAAARLEVIAAEALRINAGIKHARLAWTGTQLVAESGLHAGQVHARWLQYAAQAVVAASMRASVPLELLAANDELAAHYTEIFLHPSERSPSW
jgi:hypothetical protein